MDHREHLPIGAELVGDYRIDAVLGQGGFGVTYRAEHLGLGQPVAVKEYFPSEFATRDQTLTIQPKSGRHAEMYAWGKARFLEEARTLARFDHPAIVRVSHVFEALNSAYMVLKFEAGQTLGQWLESLGRAPSQDELDRLVAPLLDALEIMHGADFIHRDIAPDNIIIRPNGTPVLLDFGAARQAIAAETRTLTGIIKAGYSPPEQYLMRASLQGPWTNLYALGATLYRAVTGEAPAEAPERQMAQMQAHGDPLQPVTDIAGATYRRGFLTAVDRALDLNPEERPRTVSAFRTLIHATSPGDDVQQGNVPPSEPPREALSGAIASKPSSTSEPTQLAADATQKLSSARPSLDDTVVMPREEVGDVPASPQRVSRRSLGFIVGGGLAALAAATWGVLRSGDSTESTEPRGQPAPERASVPGASAPTKPDDGFPTKAITLIVPASPGGSNDAVARALARSLDLGQPVIVMNVPGERGAAAARRLAEADQDGHTLLLWGLAAAGLTGARGTAIAIIGRRSGVVFALVAPPGLDEGRVIKLNAAVNSVLETPSELSSLLKRSGIAPMAVTPQQAAEILPIR